MPRLSSHGCDERSTSLTPMDTTGDITSTMGATHAQSELQTQTKSQTQTQTQTMSQMSKRLTISQKYSKSACLCTPCLKVVTVNIVQSTYTVPTYVTPGGDLRSLNRLCKYSSRFHFFCNLHTAILFICRLLSTSNLISSPLLSLLSLLSSSTLSLLSSSTLSSTCYIFSHHEHSRFRSRIRPQQCYVLFQQICN